MIAAFLLSTFYLFPECCVPMGLILFTEIFKQGNICTWNKCVVKRDRDLTPVG